MKKTRIFLTLAITAAVISLNFTNPKKSEVAADAPYKVNTKESTLNWVGRKITYDHKGTIDIANGELAVTKNKLTGGKFTIDMTTIKDVDLTDPEKNGNLVGHLKSDDFFGVEKFPTSSLEITSVKEIAKAAAGQSNYEITGNLTIKGKTNPITFPALVSIAKGKVTASAKLVVDRSKYDVRYNSSSFFESLGDKVINDEFDLNVNLVAVK